MRLYLDLETFSTVPIAAGTHAYAEGARVLLLAWAIDDGPVSVWDADNDPAAPARLRAAFEDPTVELWAHNSAFDRTVLRHCAPIPAARVAADAIPRWRDTMVQALTHGLPGALGNLCEILKVPTDRAKDRAGRTLIQLFCKPRADGRRATRDTHPAEWARFVAYAALDVDAMRACADRLPAWNYRGAELSLWHLDQRINDRGVAVDLDLARAAVAAVGAAQAQLALRARVLTDGAVESATQRDAMLAHILAEYGVPLPDLTAATVERRVTDPDLPPALRELLAVRLSASTTSTAKYNALLRCASSDGRLRGALQFAGASRTRRWAGRLFQPQNLPRPRAEATAIEADIGAIKAGIADLVCADVMAATSDALRGCIVAPPGAKLVAADLSNIEGRVLAWLAGEHWKLDAFRAFDAGTGPDLYKLAYARSFGLAPQDVTKDQRQIGKVQELALGYEGGVGAFLTFASVYGIDLDAMAAAAPLAPDVRDEAERAWAWATQKKRTLGLARDTYVACDAIKRAWRRAHPGVTSLWRSLGEACVAATLRPSVRFDAHHLAAQRDGAWLRVRLPSGNYLCYPSPQVEGDRLSYMGVNQYSRKWSRLATYGGKLAENATQSLARDVLAHNLPAIEAAGYRIVLTVHDEVICEAPDAPEFNAEHLSGLLAANPPWAPGLPLAAEGFEAYRYRKE